MLRVHTLDLGGHKDDPTGSDPDAYTWIALPDMLE
jgi:hypothetical protein